MDFNTGWRSFWWVNTGLLLFTCLANIFFFPETRYRRAWEMPGSGVKPPGVAALASNNGVLEKNNNSSGEKPGALDAEAGTATTHERAASTRENAPDAPVTGAENNNNNNNGSDALEPQLTHQDPYLGRGRPSKKQFAPFQRYEGNFLRELWLPFYLHIYPIVEFAAFVVSWSASGFLVVNLSQTQAFAAPPYNYSSQTIGLFNLAVFIGGMVGLFTCGPLSDWVAAHLTERNGGVREPEMRLVAMIPYVVVMIIGSVITAVGYDRHWPWQVIVIIGYAFLGMQVSALPSLASTYAIDSYKPVTGSMFVTITMYVFFFFSFFFFF